ncbi:sugar ABC transporter substrate-binding protein [Martelella lutilitoris]|uniref:Sugar ABC transporter substrate-binding protein n=1 Tax=Martelella lutilitoris TaxID=2583532 RepID=A0A7T7KMR9_9HYPH|nr:sugar ABC transporter substrate-binding protein [Martelella lutilitoris]QQM32087.1 sugar ABC transporter substrate-binding protein [Martelella lutilitoris]
MRKLLTIAALSASVIAYGAAANADDTVRFWYHFDNADNPMSDLIAKFEEQNPGITIEAENVPWNSYYDNLYTSIIAGNAPDAAMVKLYAQPRLVEMGALVPIDDYISSWDGKADLQDDLLDLTKGPDGNQYYLPIQYVVLYLYYRADMLAELGMEVPKTCEEFREAAKALTQDTNGDGNPDIYGFGFRGAKGGQEHWGSLVLSRDGVSLDQPGGLTNPTAIEGTQWVVDLFQKDHVFPPSAPNDGFKEVTGALKAGKTAMTIHHIGSANDMVAALGDKISATTVPECGGGHWTTFGDESTAIFSSAENKDAAWKWISFLSTTGNNKEFNEATGQLPVTKSDSANWTLHPKRFVDATVASLPFAVTLPNTPETSDFVNTVWPVNMQRALTGEITAEKMNQNIEELFNP